MHLMYWMSLFTAFSCLPGGVYAATGSQTAQISKAAAKAVRWSLIGRRPAVSIDQEHSRLSHWSLIYFKERTQYIVVRSVRTGCHAPNTPNDASPFCALRLLLTQEVFTLNVLPGPCFVLFTAL